MVTRCTKATSGLTSRLTSGLTPGSTSGPGSQGPGPQGSQGTGNSKLEKNSLDEPLKELQSKDFTHQNDAENKKILDL